MLNNYSDGPDFQKGQLEHLQDYLKEKDAWALFDELKENLPWQQGELNMYGKKVLTPRLECFISDFSKSYAYSGQALKTHIWTPSLEKLKNNLNAKFNLNLNACLANFYRDGRDKVGWHADDEANLGKQPIITSISLGSPRTFQIRQNDTKITHSLLLKHGSLLIMKGSFQKDFQHQIPQENQVLGSRINLTFRTIKS